MDTARASARQVELLEAAYRYVLANGLGDLSLRPLAAAIGSSPRVLLFLFGSKDGLVRALLARARSDELHLLGSIQTGGGTASGGTASDRQSGDGTAGDGMAAIGREVWAWLSMPEHRALLTLWTEAYARALVEPDGAWSGFASETVADWLAVLAQAQPPDERDTPGGAARRTAVLAVLRGALLDLLATGDEERTTAAVEEALTPYSR